MDNFQQTSDSEMEIMRIIWACDGSILFGQLMSELEAKQNNWSPKTVLTFLARLTKKNIIKSEKKGRLNVYTSVLSEDEYMAIQTEIFLDKVYGGNAKKLVSTLLKQDCLTSRDFEELKNF